MFGLGLCTFKCGIALTLDTDLICIQCGVVMCGAF
jgi:hypothetical protein